jgi:hypothetical protein
LSKYNSGKSNYKTSKVIENIVNETKAPISKKEKSTFMDDFKTMNKDELLNELTTTESNEAELQNNEFDDYSDK